MQGDSRARSRLVVRCSLVLSISGVGMSSPTAGGWATLGDWRSQKAGARERVGQQVVEG